MLNDAKTICLKAIEGCLPDKAVKSALSSFPDEEYYLIAVGKAAYAMALAASEVRKIKKGIVITKYDHSKGEIDNVDIYEAGHPLLDENGVKATKKVIELCHSLESDDKVLFLLSGGASSLFESPLIKLDELQKINDQMLKKGLSIYEINTIRKKLSAVKGGRLADLCYPVQVYGIILSDVLGDKLDIIGSGPSVKDETNGGDALKIIDEYDIEINDETRKIIRESISGKATNAHNIIIGSVRILCEKAAEEAKKLGYKPIILTDHIDIEARDAGDYLYSEAMKHLNDNENIALIIGGETVVHVRGKGLGGRNQELVYSQIRKLDGIKNVLLMSVGSDGTDGPTDSAGGYSDGYSYQKLIDKGLDFEKILNDNDSYHGLKAIDGLIFTGPTGTNVNDISIALIRNR